MKQFQITRQLIVLGGFLFTSVISFANPNKWYHVEVIVIEAKDKSAFVEEWPLNPGKPSIANAVDLSNDSTANFGLLNDNQLALGKVKKRLQQNYRLVMHTGWRQMLSDNKNASTVHLIGGQHFSDNNAINDKNYEVDGVIKLSSGRYINVDADLLFHKPMKLVSTANAERDVTSKNLEGAAQFAEIPSKNWQNELSTRLQTFRLKESSRLKADEIHYIDHPLYGIIIVISPEKGTV